MTEGAYELRLPTDEDGGRWIEVYVGQGGIADKWTAAAFDPITQRHYAGVGPTAEHALRELRIDYASRWFDGKPRLAITGDSRETSPPPDLTGLVRPVGSGDTTPTPPPSTDGSGG